MCECLKRLKIWHKWTKTTETPPIDGGFPLEKNGVDITNHQISSKRVSLTLKGDPFSHALALIINIHIYDKEGYTRLGSGVDVQRLIHTFQKFNVGIYLPETANVKVCQQDICWWIQEFKSKFVDKKMEACFVVMMGHGVPGHIVDTGGQFMSIEKNVFEQFDNLNFPVMRDRPKLFFMNFCRGDIQPTTLSSSMTQSTSILDDYEAKCVEVALGLQNDEFGPAKILTMTMTDMLIFWSTVPGHASLRSANTGSRFIKTLCECLDDHLMQDQVQTCMMETMKNDVATDEKKSQLVTILEMVGQKMAEFRKNPDDPLPCCVKQTAYFEQRHFGPFIWTAQSCLYGKE